MKSSISLIGHAIQTVVDYYKEFCMNIGPNLEDNGTIIGGKDTIIQLDEWKLDS